MYRAGGDIQYEYEVSTSFGQYSIANLGMDTIRCEMIPFLLDKT